MSDQQQIIEHVVLFKVKPDIDSTKLTSMVNGLNSLESLNLTVHLTAGKLIRSQSPSLTFTHLLHARYKSKTDLSNYAAHPEHVRVVTENIKPIIDDILAVDWISNGVYAAHPEHVRVVTENIKPIIDDIMAIDWISNGVTRATGSLKPGSAIRVTFLKLKEDLGENEKARVLEVIKGIKNQFQTIEELSYGENFAHDRAKGYTIASIAVLPSVGDLEALDSNAELVTLEKEKVKYLIESVVVIDYVIPSSQSANL